ncbi:MAG: hypothetical protein IJ468_14795 [Lachnospiraceae bacterium]|nr:hypothetical protein [Lachnospiraceae bacterium]
MFVNMNVLKRLVKAAFKNNSLMIGNVEDSLIISTGHVTVQVLDGFATNSYKALIMEYLGELPKIGEVYSIGGGAGNQATVGFEEELDIYTKVPLSLPKLQRTAVRIGTWVIFQDAALNKYGVEEGLWKLYDPSEADQEKEGFPGMPQLMKDKSGILLRNDGMALKIRVYEQLNSTAFREMALIDLGEEDDWE